MLFRVATAAKRIWKTLTSTLVGRYVLSCIVGSVVGGIAFTWMLTAGTWHLFEWQRMGSFYDAQAHSLLNGHWDVPQKVLGIESFTVDGRSYLYQGPIPALLRMPVAVFGNHLDGRLTQTSMLAAYLTCMVIISRLGWRLRVLFRSRSPMTLYECIGFSSFVSLLGGGSCLLFIASRAWVYHEALIWGVALSLAAVNSLFGHLTKPSARSLISACLLTTAALLTRASIGVGPLIGLGLVCSINIFKAVPWRRARHLKARTLIGLFGTATLPIVPLTAYGAINYIKFKTLFSVPFAVQGSSLVDPVRQQMLAANNGTLFGLQFIPTTLWHYLDPTALGISRRFPFIDFPPIPGRIIGQVQFDLIDRTASVPVSFPILCVLAAIGVWAVVRSQRPPNEGRSTRILMLPLLASGACAITLLPFGYIAQRYLADFFPFLVLASLAGFHHLASLRSRTVASNARIGFTSLWAARFVTMALVVLGIGTFAINASLAISFQRAFSPDVSPYRVAGFVGFQNEVDSWFGHHLGGFQPPSVRVLDELPTNSASGSLVILGNCQGLYLNDGMLLNGVKVTPWVPVERTRSTGLHRIRVSFGPRKVGASEELVVFKDGPAKASINATYVEDDNIQFSFVDTDHFGFAAEGLPVSVNKNHEYLLEVVADARVQSLIVKLDDRVVLETYYWSPVNTLSFPERFHELPVHTTLCPKIRSSAGLDGESASKDNSYKN